MRSNSLEQRPPVGGDTQVGLAYFICIRSSVQLRWLSILHVRYANTKNHKKYTPHMTRLA